VIDTVSLEAGCVKTIDEYKEWTRKKIRPIFPHETLLSGYGHLHGGGVAIDYVVTVDYPMAYLQALRNPGGGIDSPIMRRWLATREPLLFEADNPWPDVPAAWLESFRAHHMKNVAVHGLEDSKRCIGTYHCLYRIPGRLGDAHVEALKQLAPIMHGVLCGAIGLLQVESDFASRLAGLSSRERDIARWVGLGKSNSEIARLGDLSENTVKHHLTSIFTKLAVETRAQLVHRLAKHEANVPPGFGTKIL